ncbi:hypothetical protein [Haladaptatus halobius]|uniref:hypothetical protein n=1 Tax=Haladaptatus halobius TaxID=2884875 RepID=UPI001D09B550|nr:hypothetical protein [Haladaptatus halobius]
MKRFESAERELQANQHREQVGTLSTRDVSDLIVSLDADDPKRPARAPRSRSRRWPRAPPSASPSPTSRRR